MGSPQYGALIRALLLRIGIAAALVHPTTTVAAPGDPQDAHLLSACEDPGDFSPARTPDERFDFTAWEATVFDAARVKGDSLRWHVRPSSPAQTIARLALTRPVHGPLNAISLWVKNPNVHQTSLRLEVLDADGAAYLSGPVALADETAWRQITFDLRTLSGPADDPLAGLDLPLTRVALLLEGLKQDRPHTIYLDEIAGDAAGIPTVAASDLRCQTSLGPGESFSLRAMVSPASAVLQAGVTGQLTSPAGGVLAQAPVRVEAAEGDAATITASLQVPAWLGSGRYQVRLSATFAQITGIQPLEVAVAGAAPVPMSASIVAGVSPPAISIGEEAWPPVLEELQGGLPAALSASARFVGLPATTDAHPFAWAPDASGDPERAFAGLDRRAAAVLSQRAESALVLQVFMSATPEWKAANAAHLQRFAGNTLAPPQVAALDRVLPDLASSAWQAEAEQRLRALVRHVQSSAWGHRVIGYELQAGDLGAWRPWGASLGIGDEYTPMRKEAFLDWLHVRYPDVNALRNGWLGRRRGFGLPRAGFESVEMPKPLADQPEPSLYDPSADQPMIDLLAFRAEVPADALLRMARAVREEAGESTLVGACYGHLLSQARANDWFWPHAALTPVLESGALDFLTGPQQRMDDASQPSSLGDSVRRAGLLYLERPNGAERVASDCGALVPAGEMGALSELPAPIAPNETATVIEVFDDLSARYLSGDAALPRDLLTRPIAGNIAHRSCLLRDLLGPNPPQARVFIFRDLFTVQPEQGRLLARNTARDGSLLVWVYAPAAIDDYLITGRTMQYLTGIKLVPLVSRGRLRIAPGSSQIPAFGFSGSVSPWFVSVDEDAEWLGTIEGTERCGFALRKFPQCTSVFSAAPPPEEAVRQLARRAGIELSAAPAQAQ